MYFFSCLCLNLDEAGVGENRKDDDARMSFSGAGFIHH